ncbi:hypothetical protein LCGC14_0971310 [marine sediment metagenome]|uniref:RNase NYN domain-containing protein n=1 Tax=marine sediment metagenome TaxID=412755 RepID=A0A0F9NXT0_9ZZZZ
MTLENCFTKFPTLTNLPVIIDVNNVVYQRHNGRNKPVFDDLVKLLKKLDEIGFDRQQIISICDPLLIRNIDKPTELDKLINQNIVRPAPKNADEFILGYALQHKFCFIISNDKFREYNDQLLSRNWINERRISFMIINGKFCLSPNMDFNKMLCSNSPSNQTMRPSEISTLDILERLTESEGELNLF